MRAILLLGIAMLIVPTVAAGAPDTFEITPVDGDVARTISATGSTEIDYTVTVGCAHFALQGEDSLEISLSTNLDAYYGASFAPVTVTPGPACITSTEGEVTATATLKLTPTSSAMGLLPRDDFTVTATAGDASDTYEHEEPIQIDYKGGHTTTTSILFPYNFTDEDGGAIHFNYTVDVQANSRTMVMWENVSSGGGSLDGMAPTHTFPVEEGERQWAYNLTWRPPTGNWDNATISFYTYSHSTKISPTEKVNEQTVTWTIYNDATPAKSGNGDSKGLPGLPMPAIFLAVALAVALRRRA